MKTLTVGRTHSGGSIDRIDGYRVITIDGDRVGSVDSVNDGTIAIRSGPKLFRTVRLLPAELAVIRDIDRTVLILTAPEQLPRQQKHPPHDSSFETAVESFRPRYENQ
jgi:hypothetical protein